MMKFWDRFLGRQSAVEATLKASATVTTPAIPLASKNPEWQTLKELTHKLDLANFDANLARQGYAVDGQLRRAVKQKYEKS